MDSNEPSFPDRSSFPGAPADPDEIELLTADLRVHLTVLLARSQMLQRRIRTGRITNVYACMETLGQIDEAGRELEARLTRADEARASNVQED